MKPGNDGGWTRRHHPAGGTRWFRRFGRAGWVWMATVGRPDGVHYRAEVGRTRRVRTAERQSGRALSTLRRQVDAEG